MTVGDGDGASKEKRSRNDWPLKLS